MHFTPPSSLKLYAAGLGQILNKRLVSPCEPDSKIGDYKLIREVKRSDAMPNYTFGVYARKQKQYFIKTWHTGLPDLNYYFLRNEITVSEILSHHLTSTITIPKLVEVITSGEKTTAVYEYVSGQSCDTLPVTAQAKAINTVDQWLKKISGQLTPAEKAFIPTRGLTDYLKLLPVIGLILIVRQPGKSKEVFHAVRKCYIKLYQQRHNQLVLTHRDLTSDNLKKTNNKIVVMDIESMAYTLPGYDSSFIAIHESVQLNRELKRVFKFSPNLAIQLYLLLHHTIFSGDFFHVNPENLILLSSLNI